MSLTDRDKKIAMALIPIVVLGAYWFLLISPKRAEGDRLSAQLAEVELARDEAVSRADALEGSRESYADDYATVVRLGKAIPATVDMPSLLVQLDEASRGTNIRFGKVTVGERVTAATTTSTEAPAAPDGAAAPGGTPAQTAPGTAVETAGETVQDANQTSATSEAAGEGAPAPTTPGTPSAAPGLDTVSLTFEFSGGFFDLADFFHEMKRFVYLANERVRVEGRLMTIDGFAFDSTEFPTIKTEVQATVYLSPASQGVTAGASPAGPAPVATGQAQAAPPASSATPVSQGAVQ